MRINVYTNKGVLERARNIPGGTITGYLQLVSDPLTETDAATKSYVDARFSEVGVDDITEGVFNEATMPGMTGDVVSSPGTSVVNLTPIVSAGDYVNPVINEKGLVTGSAPLVGSAVPELDWSVVQDGHPTDTLGYGIMDAVCSTGGHVNVNITLNDHPTDDQHAATKHYVDTTVLSGGSAGVSVGDIILKYGTVTPAGFLQCNGAMVSKTTYANLYAVLTVGYDNRVMLGAGKPWQQQYGFNPNAHYNFNTPVLRGALANSTANAQIAVTKNKIFVFGGSNGAGVQSNAIQSATLDANGTIGAWSNIALTLPSGMSNFQVVVARNYLYLLAGVSAGNANNFIYRTPIDSLGNLGNWQTAGVLPQGVSGHQVVVTTTRMYIIGGSIDGGITTIDNVYYAGIATDGSLGTWTAGPALPFGMQHTRVAVTKGRIYLLGGHTGSTVVPNLIYGVVDSTGAITSWTASTVLPVSIAQGDVLVTDSYVYYIGGTTSGNLSGATGGIYRAAIQADSSIGTWELLSGSFVAKGSSLVFLPGGIVAIGGIDNSGTYLNRVTQFNNNTVNVSGDLSFYYSDEVLINSGATDFRLPDLPVVPDTDMRYYIKY